MPKFWLIHSRQGHWNSPSQNQTRFLLYLRFAGESIQNNLIISGWSRLKLVAIICKAILSILSGGFKYFFNVHVFPLGWKPTTYSIYSWWKKSWHSDIRALFHTRKWLPRRGELTDAKKPALSPPFKALTKFFSRILEFVAHESALNLRLSRRIWSITRTCFQKSNMTSC